MMIKLRIGIFQVEALLKINLLFSVGKKHSALANGLLLIMIFIIICGLLGLSMFAGSLYGISKVNLKRRKTSYLQKLIKEGETDRRIYNQIPSHLTEESGLDTLTVSEDSILISLERMGEKSSNDFHVGEGAFGEIQRGIIFHDAKQKFYDVAIKTAKLTVPKTVRKTILTVKQEIEIMKYIKSNTEFPHRNIVHFLGNRKVLVDGIREYQLVTAYCPKRGLKDILDILKIKVQITKKVGNFKETEPVASTSASAFKRDKKAEYTDARSFYIKSKTLSYDKSGSVKNNETCSNNSYNNDGAWDQSDRQTENETEIACKSKWNWEDIFGNREHLDIAELKMFANKWILDIASGMRHLEKLMIAHCDLATRNIFVDWDFTAKVGDFGLSLRFPDEHTESVPFPTNKFARRWAAPETLFKSSRIVTRKSDVWGFGVCIWEILNLGSYPYSGMNIKEIKNYLNEGKRLESSFYTISIPHCNKLMENCWEYAWEDRPNFQQIIQQCSGNCNVGNNPQNWTYSWKDRPNFQKLIQGCPSNYVPQESLFSEVILETTV